VEIQVEVQIQLAVVKLSTPHGGGSTTKFTMAGVDPTIRLPEFHGEGSEDP
jgi:hypothetical protein